MASVFLPPQPSADGAAAAAAAEQPAAQRLVIWGTDVNVATCKEKFQVRWSTAWPASLHSVTE